MRSSSSNAGTTAPIKGGSRGDSNVTTIFRVVPL
jgi:hypothetical protein